VKLCDHGGFTVLIPDASDCQACYALGVVRALARGLPGDGWWYLRVSPDGTVEAVQHLADGEVWRAEPPVRVALTRRPDEGGAPW
jgi:uncharacterized protein YndB with AHSA1/START domain